MIHRCKIQQFFLHPILTYGVTALILASVVTGQARAEWTRLSVEERLTRLERTLQNQSMSDLLLQVQRLQDELQKMRGKLEVQAHLIEQLSRSQPESARANNTYSSGPVTTATDAPAAAPVATKNTYSAWGSAADDAQQSTDSQSDPLIPAPESSTAPQAAAKTPTTAERNNAAAANPTGELEDYQQAFGQLKDGKYSAATESFRSLLTKYPDGKYASNAQYWLGETYYVTRDFDAAEQAFSKLLQLYTGSNKTAGAMLKLGFINHERGQTAKAIEFLERVVQQFPESTEAKLAQPRLELLRKR